MQAIDASEVWRSVECVPGYEVSSLGRVRRSKPMRGTRAGKIVLPHVSTRGYHRVALYSGGVVTRAYVHRLVALAFVDNPSGLPQINHLNGVKTDNCVANLEWSTGVDNQMHAIRAGRMAQKLDVDRVIAIRRLCASSTLRRSEIADLFGVSPGTIYGIETRRIWRHVA